MNNYIRPFIIGLTALLMMGPAAAQTLGYAEAIRILSSSCGKDIQKYCKKVKLGNNRIQSCLADNASKVSPTCKIDYVRVYVLLAERHAAQDSVAKICGGDAKRLCPSTTRGKGFTLQCLLNKRKLSKACGQVITDAGFR